MKNVSKKDVETVIDALQIYYKHIIATRQFHLQEFMNFMEPKFTEAGYRTHPRSGSQTNILILHDSGVGDFIIMSGAIREIRRLYPKAKITLVIYPRALELAEFCPYVDEIITNPRTTCANWNMLMGYYEWNVNFARQLLERHFDICYAFPRYPDSLFLMYMSGANVRITYDYPDKSKDFIPLEGDIPIFVAVNLANLIVPRLKFGTHITDLSFSLIDNILNAPVENRSLEIWYSPLDKVTAESIVKNLQGKIYALCMGGMNLAKCYPPEMYAKVVEMIFSQENDANFVILGGGQNDLISAEIFIKNLPEKYRKNILNLVGKITYRQSGAVLSFCDMYIGNDSGTMHMAAGVKCPVLMPKCFPIDIPQHYSDSPKYWYPYNVPNITIQPEHALPECAADKKHNHYGCKSKLPHCITQIKPETVFKGFNLLKQRIEQKINEPLYIY